MEDFTKEIDRLSARIESLNSFMLKSIDEIKRLNYNFADGLKIIKEVEKEFLSMKNELVKLKNPEDPEKKIQDKIINAVLEDVIGIFENAEKTRKMS